MSKPLKVGDFVISRIMNSSYQEKILAIGIVVEVNPTTDDVCVYTSAGDKPFWWSRKMWKLVEQTDLVQTGSACPGSSVG